MQRIAAIAFLTTCLLAVRGPAAQIVVVLSSGAEPYVQAEAGLKAGLGDKAEMRSVPLGELTQKGIDATIGKADAVVAIGTPAALWLHKQLPAATPLAYCMVADPQNAGLAEGRPSYGVSTDIPIAIQLALIAEALPQARTIGMLYHSDTPDGQRRLKLVREALPQGWQVEAVAVEKHNSIAAAIDELTRKRIAIVWTALDPTVFDTSAVRALLLAGLRANIPIYGFSPAVVKAGALLGTGVDPSAQGQQVAGLALRLLAKGGSPPAERVAAPQRFQIAINLIVAEKFGVQPPDGLVQRASQVIRGEK